MSETPKTKPAGRMRQMLLIWLISFAFITVATGIVVLITDHMPNKWPGIEWALIFGVFCASIAVGLLAFIRWIGCWRNLRYALVGVAILATLVAIFYTEEDFRGKRTWENSKREAEAKGMILDWNKYIPALVPADQNFYTASSNILLRFQRIPEDDTNEIEAASTLQWLRLDPMEKNRPLFPRLDTSKSEPIVIAKITISSRPTSLESGSNTLVVTANDPAAPKRARQLVQSTMGQTINGAQGFEFSERNLADIQPAQIFMQADSPPSVADLSAFTPTNTIGDSGRLQVVATADPKIFQIQLTKNFQITAAQDYLNWSDQFIPAFDDIREALKRPYAILPGDYTRPYLEPIPNFVIMRSLAQTLAQRAQCYLLLGEPDKALHELTLVHDVCRILEKPPTGQPETLVEAMINVAITGLYTAIISEGLERHAWQEAQLVALQQQLAEINLPAPVVRAFETMPASSTHTLEITPSWKVADWFSVSSGTRSKSLWQTIKDGKLSPHLEMWLMPRGWIYQNMTAIADMETSWQGSFDPENGTVLPSGAEHANKAVDKMLRHISPYNFFAAIAIPNFTRAWQTTAYNQTLANETQIACALERCRLVHGEYPDSLDALAPKYIETLPHDIIGGQPLHYRRTADGKFLLYSIGWNEKDDGGKRPPKGNNAWNIDFTRGDWVWPGTTD